MHRIRAKQRQEKQTWRLEDEEDVYDEEEAMAEQERATQTLGVENYTLMSVLWRACCVRATFLIDDADVSQVPKIPTLRRRRQRKTRTSFPLSRPSAARSARGT